MSFEKPHKGSNRDRIRKVFQAAVLAASVASGAANAEEMPSGMNRANRLLSEDFNRKSKEGKETTSPSLPSGEDADAILGYLTLQQKLYGAHLHRLEPVKEYKQFAEFCDELSIFCDRFATGDDVPHDTAFSPELYARIRKINQDVNAKLIPMEDMQHYKTPEKWTIPEDAGDCEDYVLLKMTRLLDAGFDPKNLHILVVRDETKQGHAVLGVDVIESGHLNTLVLDNKIPDILTIKEMEKRYEGSLASFVVALPEGGHRVRFFRYGLGGGW